MHLHWHRRDLRIADNLALDAANGPIAGLFVFDPAVLEFASPPRIAFLLDALASLREAYRDRGSDLLVARGDPSGLIPDLVGEGDVTTVSWCSDYSGLARERDDAVRAAVADAGAQPATSHDAILHEPGSITTNEGTPYQVFTYYSRKWHDRNKRDPVEPPESSAFARGPDDAFESATTGLPGLDDLGFSPPEATVLSAGTDAARERLADFCAGPIYRYAEERDYPAAECTSRLSADLKYGTIGIREVHAETEAAMKSADGESEGESVREFQDQLAWREFYVQVLADRPETVVQNFKSYERPIEWRTDEEALRAWKDGETGYPIVDAGMRQLRAEAFVHNRVRMIVASFLTKDLLLDWRQGYRWFRRKLVDHDTANDVGGWQWAASTGTDAQPYFRIFNPATQAERFDPDGEYVRRYVPELAGVPADAIHAWPDLEPEARREHAPEYPDPIVDHGERREAAIAMFERARGE